MEWADPFSRKRDSKVQTDSASGKAKKKVNRQEIQSHFMGYPNEQRFQQASMQPILGTPA
jgi:hypothetical protein